MLRKLDRVVLKCLQLKRFEKRFDRALGKAVSSAVRGHDLVNCGQHLV